MKKIILAAVIAGIGSTAAFAADLAPYTKAPMMADIYNWTGFYVGGDIGGGSSGGVTSSFSQAAGFTDLPVVRNDQAGATFVGGVHAGYNWQFAPHLLAGIEGDWQSVRVKNSFCRVPDEAGGGCFDNDRGVGSFTSELNWVATARARLGWTQDRLMVYGTGGVAFADVKSSLGLSCLVEGCGDSRTLAAGSTSSSTTKTGWVLGAGAEWMLTRNWILRAEYQHIDLGNVSLSLSPGCDGCSLSTKQDARLDILRAGVSYKFGG